MRLAQRAKSLVIIIILRNLFIYGNVDHMPYLEFGNFSQKLYSQVSIINLMRNFSGTPFLKTYTATPVALSLRYLHIQMDWF